ncbi:MAG: Ubiquitin-conjugating enzyme [Blastocatellia bacterium]
MNEERFKTELNQLITIKRILQDDKILPLRFDIERLTLDHRRFKVTIRGITSLIVGSSSSFPMTANNFPIRIEVPSGYPWHAIPSIRFESPIPFHPHVFTHGGICWGTGNSPNPDLTISDWIRGVVEYLQYNQDQASMLKINPSSPANREALNWWQQNNGSIRRYIPPIDMARFRVWINRTRG